MKEYKNIDRLFQEKFRDFEIYPSTKIWNNIDRNINNKPKKERTVFWLWFSGIAAGLALLFTLINPLQTTTIHTEKQKTATPVIQKKKLLKTTTEDSEVVSNPTTNQKISAPIITEKQKFITQTNNNYTPQKINNAKAKNTPIKNNSTPPVSPSKNLTYSSDNTKTVVANNTITSLKDNTKKITESNVIPKNATKKIDPIKRVDNTILADNSDKKTIHKKTNTQKWSVSTVAAPVFLNSFTKNISSIDQQFNNNTKQGKFSAAYGVQLAYQVSNRLSLQSGVHLVDYGYKTYNVFVSPSGAISRFSNINYDSEATTIEVCAAAPPNQSTTYSEEARTNSSKGNLMQIYGYIEVPLEVKYHLNKKNPLGINIIGGFSTLFLNKNQIFIETEGLSSKLGEASNLNTLNFSGNLGVEFDYKLYQNLHFNLVPMFKVQTHTFEKNTGGFNPYTIGVYSGLNLRF